MCRSCTRTRCAPAVWLVGPAGRCSRGREGGVGWVVVACHYLFRCSDSSDGRPQRRPDMAESTTPSAPPRFDETPPARRRRRYVDRHGCGDTHRSSRLTGGCSGNRGRGHHGTRGGVGKARGHLRIAVLVDGIVVVDRVVDRHVERREVDGLGGDPAMRPTTGRHRRRPPTPRRQQMMTPPRTTPLPPPGRGPTSAGKSRRRPRRASPSMPSGRPRRRAPECVG